MKVEIKIDPSLTETVVTVVAPGLTPEVAELTNTLSLLQAPHSPILGIRGSQIIPLHQEDIIRIVVQNGKVLAYTQDGAYALRIRLYEVEERLDSHTFVRISQSEIINLDHVSHFDTQFPGTFQVIFDNKATTYVSRRYVNALKSILGLSRKNEDKGKNPKETEK